MMRSSYIGRGEWNADHQSKMLGMMKLYSNKGNAEL